MSFGHYHLNPDVNNLEHISVVVMPAKSNLVGGVMPGPGTSIATDGTISVVGGGAPATASDTAPVNPQPGALWFDTVGQALYIWYQDPNSSQWVVAVNQPKPAYNWVDWTITAVSNVTLGTVSYAKVYRAGQIAFFGCRFTGTVGTGINAFTLSGLPNVYNVVAGVTINGYLVESDLPLLAEILGNGQISVRDPSKSNYPQGTWTFSLSGFYPAA